MNIVEPRGAVHWIDHFVVGTNNMSAWVDWAVNSTGINRQPIIGLTTPRANEISKPSLFLVGRRRRRIGAFLQPEFYPPAKELGKDLPRCGFYIRPEDIDKHLRPPRPPQGCAHRCDRTAADGDDGTGSILRPDGNQYELWAPVEMPEGAMDIATTKVSGASATPSSARAIWQKCRVLCKILWHRTRTKLQDRRRNFVLRLAPAPLVYKLVDKVDERVSGHGTWWDMHTALTVRQKSFCPTTGVCGRVFRRKSLQSRSQSQPRRTGSPTRAHRSAPQPGGESAEGNLQPRR